MKKHLVFTALVVACVVLAPAHAGKGFGQNGLPHSGSVKNVIMMVPDGCAQSIQTLARWYKGGPLALDRMNSGTTSTYMANSVITGSAASATAFATGYKTTVRFLGIGPRPDDVLTTYELPYSVPGLTEDDKWGWLAYRPLATVLEGAKLSGRSTGLVATSRITHATPAAFACHVDDRGKDNEIMEHLVYQDVDVVFGGGERHLLPSPDGRRTDEENLKDILLGRGYQYVQTGTELAGLSHGKAWGMFASSHMLPDLDRRYLKDAGETDEPSLAEMTSKAIELLSKNPHGFLLVVEASQVDWAGHANDPIYMVTDFLAFDEAVQVALDFAAADGETMLVAFPDHNTGALALGNEYSPVPYTATSVEDLIGPLQGMKVTSGFLEGQIDDKKSPAEIKAAVQEYWGISLTDDNVTEILQRTGAIAPDPVYQDLGTQSLGYAIAEVVSRRHTVFGWTTHGHSGEDVPLWSYGPMGPVGFLDNTQLAETTAQALGLNLDLSDRKGLNAELFVEAGEAFPYRFKMDLSDQENPVLRIGRWRLPAGKDLLIRASGVGPRSCELDGLAIYAPETGKGYIPRQAVKIIRRPWLWWRYCR